MDSRGFNVLIRIFRRVRPMSNVAESKTMKFQLGATYKGMSEEAFSQMRKV